MKAVVLLLGALLLVGCLRLDETRGTEQPSQVTVYREPSPRDSLFPMLFLIDGRPVVQLQPEEEHSFDLPPGDHKFQYELGLHDCSQRVRLEAGGQYVYRLAVGCVIAPEDRPLTEGATPDVGTLPSTSSD
jgi:hypothetical protein